jgi:hypothetical protein
MMVGVANATILPAFLDWATEHDGPSGLHEITRPVQLLFPTKDLVFPRHRYGERLIDAVPNAEVHDLPGAGHMAMWDHPQQVARAIVEFTSRTQNDARHRTVSAACTTSEPLPVEAHTRAEDDHRQSGGRSGTLPDSPIETSSEVSPHQWPAVRAKAQLVGCPSVCSTAFDA